ncbi:Fe-hydrogenase; simple [Paratrimastix pyriformis]|uniref:Centrosomal protein 43 n=1 Tax=Paratrimastix pyriformis TaxID=342808 RepID=A0ABQ8UCY6_9EUKA|nr:Fe-hydrogenase; simple [Paratrimastix pyriformis]
MASFDELKAALRETLEANGSMRQLRAQIRSEIFKALDDQQDSKPPPLASEHFFLNELVREYLAFHKYNHTLNVFLPESGQPETGIDRSFLIRECGLNENGVNPTVPVLYSLVAAIRRMAVTPPSQPHPSIGSVMGMPPQPQPTAAPVSYNPMPPQQQHPSIQLPPPPPSRQPSQLSPSPDTPVAEPAATLNRTANSTLFTATDPPHFARARRATTPMESGTVTNLTMLHRKLTTTVARAVLRGDLEEIIDRIPHETHPSEDKIMSSRCCRHQERAITKYRLMALLGFRIENETDESRPLSAYARDALERPRPLKQHGLTVVGESCRSCTPASFFVTTACQGCAARPCMSSCPKNAISRVDGRAKIDPELCIHCGTCQRVCPYHAIIKLAVPCEEACPVGAIAKAPNGRAVIDWHKCIHCGQCQLRCPFGSVLEPSHVVDVPRRPVIALVASAVLGNFPCTVEQLFNALKSLGFADVVDVSLGADRTAGLEAAEFVERVLERHDPLMTTSCCPAYYQAVQKHAPQLFRYVTGIPSPMQVTGAQIKHARPETSIDFALTALELAGCFAAAEIDVSRQPGSWTASSLCPRALATVQGTNTALVRGMASAVQAALPSVCRYRMDRPLPLQPFCSIAEPTQPLGPATSVTPPPPVLTVTPTYPSQPGLVPPPFRRHRMPGIKISATATADDANPRGHRPRSDRQWCNAVLHSISTQEVTTPLSTEEAAMVISTGRVPPPPPRTDPGSLARPVFISPLDKKAMLQATGSQGGPPGTASRVITAAPAPAHTPVTQMLIDSGLVDPHGRPY